MSRMLKILPAALFAVMMLTAAVSAETDERGESPDTAPAAPAQETGSEELYGGLVSEQMTAGGAASAFEDLPDDTRRYFYEFGLNPDNPGGLAELQPDNIFKTLLSMLSDRISAPFLGALSVLAVVLLGALAKNLSAPGGETPVTDTFHYISALAAGAAVLLPLMNTVQTVQKTIQACGIFMAGFVPVFAGILIAAGKISTAAGFSALLLSASEAVAQTAAGVVTPLTGMFFALSVSAELGPGFSIAGFSETLRKAGTYVLTFLMTVFLGILGIQTAIGSAADTLAAKTAKFVVGSFVPVVGSALGEAVGAVSASLSMVRSTVGIYAVIAVFLLIIPVILELALWRLTVYFAKAAADLFELKKLGAMLAGAGNALAFLFGILILVTMLFIISLAVVISMGSKTV